VNEAGALACRPYCLPHDAGRNTHATTVALKKNFPTRDKKRTLLIVAMESNMQTLIAPLLAAPLLTGVAAIILSLAKLVWAFRRRA
jgi:hypothetical protein